MGPEILYGFPAAVLLNTSMTATINPNTGGLSSVSIETVPFFGSGVAAAPNAQFLYASAGTQIFGHSIGQTNGTLTPIAGSPFPFPSNASIQGLATAPNSLFLYAAGRSNCLHDRVRKTGVEQTETLEQLPNERRPHKHSGYSSTGRPCTSSDAHGVPNFAPRRAEGATENSSRGSRQTPASNVVMLSLFALPFWLEDLSESQAASFANCLRRQVPTLDDPRGGANPISDSAKDCCRCAFDGANTVGVQLVPDVADPFRA